MKKLVVKEDTIGKTYVIVAWNANRILCNCIHFDNKLFCSSQKLHGSCVGSMPLVTVRISLLQCTTTLSEFERLIIWPSAPMGLAHYILGASRY